MPTKCVHGIFDEEFLKPNLKQLDLYYSSKLSQMLVPSPNAGLNYDQLDQLDDRVFIDSENRMHTPIKLISPLSYTGGRKLVSPVTKNAN